MTERFWKRSIVACGVLAAASLALACVKTPYTGRKALILVPEDQEMQLGADAYKEVLSKEKLCNDATTNGTVRGIGKRIADVSGREKWDWEFRTIDDAKTPNAFALPGGKVAVYTGILKPAENDAALAGVMGHEVAHAVARHGAQRISQGLMVELGLAAADISLKDSKQHDVILGAIGAGAALGVLLPYSREHESEADEIGMILMAKAGYDPNEIVAFWRRFGKLSKGKNPPEFLSTHPAPSSRVRKLKKLLPKAVEIYRDSSKQPRKPVTVPASC